MAYTHALLVFHWSWFTPTHCLLFIGHGLYPCNACFSLAMIYTDAMFVLHWSQLILTHSLFLVTILLILSTAGCICQQHPLGSSQVKGIYYTHIIYYKILNSNLRKSPKLILKQLEDFSLNIIRDHNNNQLCNNGENLLNKIRTKNCSF